MRVHPKYVLTPFDYRLANSMFNAGVATELIGEILAEIKGKPVPYSKQAIRDLRINGPKSIRHAKTNF